MRPNGSNDILENLYNTSKNTNKTAEERRQAKLRLDAYNAFVMLTHFDTFLAITLGKAINITSLNNLSGKDKYSLNDRVSNLITTWRDDEEDINVEAETDVISKLAITTTRKIKWGSDQPVDGEYIHFQDFAYIISKIKDLCLNEDV